MNIDELLRIELGDGTHMGIILQLINRPAEIAEAIIWYRLMTAMLDRKYKKRYYILAAVLMVILSVMKEMIFSLPGRSSFTFIGTIVLMGSTLIVNVFLFHNSFFEKFIWWGVYYFGLLMMELLAVIIIPAVSDISIRDIQTNDTAYDLVWFGTKAVTMLVFELFINFRKFRNGKLQINSRFYKNLWLLIIFNIFLIVGCVILYFNLHNTRYDLETLLRIFYFVVVVTMIVSLVLVFRIERDSRKEMMTNLKLQQMELELQQHKEIMKVTGNLRKLRHDMNNHIGLIRELMNTERYDEVRDYVNQLYGDVKEANELVISDNNTLQVLMNAKKNKARERSIDFQNFLGTSLHEMQDKDLCILLGNLLDNAIEAAGQALDRKYIDFSLQKTKDGSVITCVNSFGVKPRIKKGRFVSSKQNAAIHGIGTENIRDIVAKYQGEIQFDYDEEAFQVRIVLPV